MKRLAALLFFSFLLTGCGPSLPIQNPFEPDRGRADRPSAYLKILVLDVGQGDSTLVIGPTGHTLLIDGGPRGAGASVILPLLETGAINSLDWVMATHYDADHIGGLAEVFRGLDGVQGTDDDRIPLRALLDRGNSTDKDTPSFKEYLETAPSGRQQAVPGLTLDLGDGAKAEVILVNGHYADGRSIHLNPDEENEASIGLLITFGDFKYFTAGDLTGGGDPGGYETKDLETYAGDIVGDIDVLHAGHHGSASSTNPTFLETTRPEAAIISVGRDNDYGHPTEEVLSRLEAVGAAVYRTDLMGNLEIKSTGTGFEILPF